MVLVLFCPTGRMGGAWSIYRLGLAGGPIRHTAGTVGPNSAVWEAAQPEPYIAVGRVAWP